MPRNSFYGTCWCGTPVSQKGVGMGGYNRGVDLTYTVIQKSISPDIYSKVNSHGFY